MAFEAKKPNPIYSINTKIQKVASGITEQNGNQNIIYDEQSNLKGKLYKQSFIPVYKGKNVKKEPLNVEILKMKYDSYFNLDSGDVYIVKDNEETEPYIKQKELTTQQGALRVFVEGN